MEFPFCVSSPEKEGILGCSKWLRHAVLFDEMEFQSFLKQLGTCFFVPATGVMTKNSWNISVEDLIVRYREYLSSLRQKEQLPSQEMRHFFSLFLYSSLDDFYAISLPQERFVIKTR